MDTLDHRLLDLLLDNGRASYAQLARQLGLSEPAVAERVAKLEERGVITGYSAQIDRQALGYGVECLISLRLHATTQGLSIKALEALPALLSCQRVTGEDCFTLRAAVRDMNELEALIDQLIRYGTSKTVILLSTPFSRDLPLPAT